MRILGIETSCDETAVCLIEAEGDLGRDFRYQVLGNALASQAAIHAQYGGVFPNVAKREHARALVPLLEHVLQEAASARGDSSLEVPHRVPAETPELSRILEREPELWAALEPFLRARGKPAINCIAVTAGPGLEPCLWVGVNFAKALSLAWDIPLVAVNHMEGHIMMSLMAHPDTSEKSEVSGYGMEPFEFPLLALLISGGHTELVLSKEFGAYELIGRTRDDAAGEAFDKVARMLGLPYPGGPEISRLAALARSGKAAADGDSSSEASPSTVRLPRPMLHEDNFDFSFSGLKTAVRTLIESLPEQGDSSAGGVSLHAHQLADAHKEAIAREFEDAVADVLVEKTLRAVDAYGAHTVVVGGGVSANTYIRRRLKEALDEEGGIAQLLVPPPELATDNALMIALAGSFRARAKEFADIATLRANGNLALASLE